MRNVWYVSQQGDDDFDDHFTVRDLEKAATHRFCFSFHMVFASTSTCLDGNAVIVTGIDSPLIWEVFELSLHYSYNKGFAVSE